MGCNNKCSFTACGSLGIVISLIFGALIGTLFAFGLIPNMVIAVWIAFGLGVLALILLIISALVAGVSAPNAVSKCLCTNSSCMLAGIIGTIIAAIVALSIVLNPALIAVAVVVAILAFFFSLMIINLIAFVECIACRTCRHHESDE